MTRSRRGSYGQNRSSGGAFTNEERADFFLGLWVTCRSTCVDQARWISEEGQLEVVFKPSGTPCRYPMSGAMAEAFAAAPSKRGWIWDHIQTTGGDFSYVGY